MSHGNSVSSSHPLVPAITRATVPPGRVHWCRAAMAETTMTVVAAAAFLLMNVQFSHSCDEEGRILICTSLPPYFSPGYLTLMMYVRDFGEINSTMFSSNNLSSVTRLVINSAGVTAVADGAFGSLQSLTRLSLNYNALTQISSSWFGRPAVLTELNLTGNQVEAVNGSMLSGLVNLTQLSLNNNKITSIAPNAFSSHTSLAELDLSDNKLTRISAQVFGSLGSTRVRLHRNPWDCTCDAEASVASLKDLWSRSLLDAQMEVTCETPPPLRGKPVWNVSVCVTSGTQTTRPRPTDAFSTGPASAGASAASLATTSPTRPTAETKTSVRPKPTDMVTTITLKTTADVTSSALTPPSETRTSVQPKPSAVSPQTELSEPSSSTSCTLVIVIATLCVLLSVLGFLALLHRRKRNSKIVIPGRPDEDGKELEEGGGSGQHQLPGRSEARWPFTGPRAKSANAVLFRSSFSTSGKDEAEAQAKGTGSPGEGRHTPVREDEAEPVTQTGLSDTEERADAGRDRGENTEAVPYLSIGTNPDDTNKQSTDSRGQRSLQGKVMGRICTWPLTATQWQVRCKLKEEEEGADVVTDWTQNETIKFSSEIEEIVSKEEHGSDSDGAQQEDEAEKNQVRPPTASEAHVRCSGSTKPDDEASSASEAHVHTDVGLEEQIKEDGLIQDVAPGRRTEGQHQRLSCKPADNPSNKPSKSSSEAEQRRGPKGAAQRGGSKAPSGGTTPHDEALLSGNDYAFMDLLHEVVQNNGRWTRERWKQIHVNRQRR